MMKLFKQRSLRARLIIFLSAITLLAMLIATLVGWVTLRKEINQLFDTQQIFFAERLASSGIAEGFLELQESQIFQAADIDDDALAFAIFTDRGEQIINDGRNGRFIPFAPKVGFDDIISNEYDDEDEEYEQEQWRIYWLKQNNVYIAVGQEMDYRQDLINKVIFAQIRSLLPIFPLLILGIFLLVRNELRALKKLEKEVLARKPDEITEIKTDFLPSEVIPLVNSLNLYFLRTQTLVNRERKFISDAAHELRSPLAGLRVQTELAQLTANDPLLHAQALTNLLEGIDRISQLIEQLLTISRLENTERLDGLEKIEWRKLIEFAVSDIYPQAERKKSEIIVEIQSEPVAAKGKPILLQLVLRNLLDNAIRYTPEKSIIKITLTKQQFCIEDNGLGVSPENLAKLGQPFFRPLERPNSSLEDEKGSGLGISIVRKIVNLHSFTLHISQSEMGGLKTEIIFA